MGEQRHQLSQAVIKGFKSIKECELDLRNINVLIGANGAGKSNFVSAFEWYESILKQEMNLYASKKGMNSLFYKGTEITDSIQMVFVYGENRHEFEIIMTENNRLIFRNEIFTNSNRSPDFAFKSMVGLEESSIKRSVRYSGDERFFLTNNPFCVYHFHDTGATSKIKREHNLSNCKTFQKDASNLAAFLYRLREYHLTSYNEILRAVQLVAPYFKDFELEPSEHNRELIVLRWKQIDCEDIFNASQLSDGTLRFICLSTLLLQPTALQPSTIIIDEPELGLHPFAITILAEMVKKVALNRQVILATQSVELLDNFEVEDVIVVDSDKNGSEFKRLDAKQLKLWLDNDYTLGELWNKNIFGGRP